MKWPSWFPVGNHDRLMVVLTFVVTLLTAGNVIVGIWYASIADRTAKDTGKQTERMICAANMQAQAAQAMADTAAKQEKTFEQQLVNTSGAFFRPETQTFKKGSFGQYDFQITWKNTGHSPSKIEQQFVFAKLAYPSLQTIGKETKMPWSSFIIYPGEDDPRPREEDWSFPVSKAEERDMQQDPPRLIFRIQGKYSFNNGFNAEPIVNEYCFMFRQRVVQITNGVPEWGGELIPCKALESNISRKTAH